MSKRIASFPDQNTQDIQNIIDNAPAEVKEENYLEVGVRPWGLYYVLEDKPNFKVKKIVVNPDHRLSLQSHKHRSEHWVVVSGTATVEIRNTALETEWIYDLHPNESCYIKMNTTHRLANYGKIPLVIVEVQVGEYTGEDDIIRYEDDYSRKA
jgi:mannose-1-phosphate guanylyltransferase